MADVWTKRGITEAVKLLLTENSPLFGSMIRNVREYPELKQMLYAMLFKEELKIVLGDKIIVEAVV